MALILSTCIFSNSAFAVPSVGLLEYIDTFDGYSFKYPKNWIQVRGAGADIFFRDPFVLDENLSVEFSSPSSSRYNSVQDLGPPEEAGKKVLKQYLTEFMSTRLGVRRESNILSTSSRMADDGRTYYQVEVICFYTYPFLLQFSPFCSTTPPFIFAYHIQNVGELSNRFLIN